MPVVAYRHWSFRGKPIFRPDGPQAALADTNQFFVNGLPIPNDAVHEVRTLFGFGYVGIYVYDAKGRAQLNAAGDDVMRTRLWGWVTLRPRLLDERWETVTHGR